MTLLKLQERASTWIMNRMQALRGNDSVLTEEYSALSTAKNALDRVTPIKAIIPRDTIGYACPRCGHHFEGKQHYCHNCGQHVSYRGTEDQRYSLITEPQDVDIVVKDGKVELSVRAVTIAIPADLLKSLNFEDETATSTAGEVSYKSYY